MTGLDYKHAHIDIREKFAFTKEKAKSILSAIKAEHAVDACVLISTCNRTELYLSVSDIASSIAPSIMPSIALSPTKILCNAINQGFEDLFIEKSGEAAFNHLCRMASGLDSQIIGDDQIITQVREALELSRNQNSTNSYIEKVFNLAIQAAKAIKTHVIIKSLGVGSAPSKAVEKLKSLGALTDRKALVIGNGQMGRLVSSLLIQEKAHVTVTLREYKKGVVQVSDGADTIGYSERYKIVEKADIVISATTSPHFTLYRADFDKLSQLPEIVIDLSVPRDVEPSIGEIPGIVLLTIDDLTGTGRVLPSESARMINQIILEYTQKYYSLLSFKTAVTGGAV